MKKMRLLLMAVAFLLGTTSLFAQGINSGSPTVEFGEKTAYEFGIMPSNLPSGGTYGRSQDAAEQYEYWVQQFVEPCTDGSYRVKFDNTAQTVSEGIAYGMLLSVYAGDKVRFDGFWKFFKNSMNSHGLMNWMTDGCNGNARDNAATDADLDAAHALIIASKQWPNSTSPYNYQADAIELLGNIKEFEMDQNNYNTLNGDMWFDNNKLNPSYQSPAYYTEFAKVDVANKDFWNNAAKAASDLLALNRDVNTGLVSNWCHADGSRYADKTPDEYGADACRNPWRMATDVLWHGTSAQATSIEIAKKVSDFISGHEHELKGPMQPNADNPGVGTYKIGTYSTFALVPMAQDASYQSSLNDCYTNVVGLSRDNIYFNQTLKTLTLFVLTGNFWEPEAANVKTVPDVLNAETNADGTEVYVQFTTDIATPASSEASNFSIIVDGTPASGAVTAIAADGTNGIILTVTAGEITPGTELALAYAPGNIQSDEGAALPAFSDKTIKNKLAGNSIILDDCEDGNSINQMGGVWFTYDDHDAADATTDPPTPAPGASIITPLTSKENPFTMDNEGADGSSKSAYVSYTLDVGNWIYSPFVGLGVKLNPEGTMMDLSSSDGISFWYKGSTCRFQVGLDHIGGGADYGKTIPASLDWEHYNIAWSDLTQPNWANGNAPKPWETVDGEQFLQLAWHHEGDDGETGEFWVDNVIIEGYQPTPLTSIELDPATLILDTETANADTATIEVVYTPADATYKEIVWSTSDATIAVVDEGGLVTGLASGNVMITGTSKIDSDVNATCLVTVKGAEVLPESVAITGAPTSLDEGSTVDLDVTVLPADTEDKSVTWSTSDPAIATVDADGIVTGQGDGTVTIKATSNAVASLSDEVTIQVNGIVTLVDEIIIPSTKTIFVDSLYVFTAVVNPTGANNKELVWTSSSANVEVVDATTGEIKGISVGDATITATAADGSGTFAECLVSVEVDVVLATKVTLNKSTLTLLEGAKETLIATVAPEGTVSNDAVVWSTSAAAIADVDPVSGEVTAVAKGDALITATAADGSGKLASCLVTVEEIVSTDYVTSITITEGDISVDKNTPQTLTVDVLPATAEQTVVWSSSDELTVSVDATSGEITGLKTGSATITATATDGSDVEGSITVTVNPTLVSSLSAVDAKTILLGTTGTVAVSVLPADADDKSLVWSTTGSFVSVDATTGLISALSVGTQDVVATAADGSGESVTISVTVSADETPVTAVDLDVTTLPLVTGNTTALTVSVEPAGATNSEVVWQSSDVSVAIVDQNGIVTAVSAGTATITVISKDNTEFTASCEVTVTDTKVSSVSVEASTVSLESGDVAAIDASVTPEDATNTALVYTTGDGSVATVSKNGVITAVGKGSTVITVAATDGSGEKATVSVSVTEPGTATIAVTEISLDMTEVAVVKGFSETVTVNYVIPSDATNKAIEWTSSNTAVADVVDGVITGVGVGTAVISASSADEGNAISTVLVTVTTDATLVSSITSTTTGVELTVGGSSETVALTILPATADDKTVTWSSNDESIAIVNNGVISPVASGVTFVSVAANDGSGVSLTIPVSVSVASGSDLVTDILLGSATLNLTDGGSSTISASVKPAGASNSLTWVSGDESIATVSSTGLVTAKSAGTTVITIVANDGSGVTAKVAVNVAPVVVAPTTVDVNVDSEALTVGEYTFFTASVLPSNVTNDKFDITTDVSGIVEINAENNSIKALTKGTVVVTFASDANPTIKETITIEVSEEAVTPVDTKPLEDAINLADELVRFYKDDADLTVQFAIMDLKDAIDDATDALDNDADDAAAISAATTALVGEISSFTSVAMVKTAVSAEAKVELAVYPTPATETATVTAASDIATVSAVTIDGASVVLAEGVDAAEVQVSVEGLATGVYTLVVVLEDGTIETTELAVQ